MTHLRGMASTYKCAPPYHPDTGSHGQLFRPCWNHQHGTAVGFLYDPKVVFRYPLLPKREHFERTRLVTREPEEFCIYLCVISLNFFL